ncbi:hypothetical protein KCU88_g347, partial [Aureobasidium melanogenum]
LSTAVPCISEKGSSLPMVHTFRSGCIVLWGTYSTNLRTGATRRRGQEELEGSAPEDDHIRTHPGTLEEEIESFASSAPHYPTLSNIAIIQLIHRVQSIDPTSHQQTLTESITAIPFQSHEIAEIHAMRDSIGDCVSERFRVRKTEIQPLPGERVDSVCGVADEGW